MHFPWTIIRMMQDWISRYEAFGKPLLNLEYTFSSTERGLSPVNAATSVASIADRGMAYKSFVESETSHPLFIGSGWFSYFDQAVTWRKDGENYNIGLVNQQDQPYTDMVNIMKTVNAGLGKCAYLRGEPRIGQTGYGQFIQNGFFSCRECIRWEDNYKMGIELYRQ